MSVDFSLSCFWLWHQCNLPDLKAIMLCVTFHRLLSFLPFLHRDNINELWLSVNTTRWFRMLKYSWEIFIERVHLHIYHRSQALRDNKSGNYSLLSFHNPQPQPHIVSFSFTPMFCLHPFLPFFFSPCPAAQIDSAFLISQRNPINFIVIAAINI